MNFSNSLQLTQSQKLMITTQLKQSLSILSMSRLEIEEEIKREAESNPLLEAEKTTTEVDWESYIKYMEKTSRPIDKNEMSYNSDNEINLENLVKYSSNIYEHLLFQISLYTLNDVERNVCEYIIESLDEDGYLRLSDKEIIESLKIDQSTFDECLENIQQLEPSGVGARSLAECLIIQMRDLGINNEILEDIIKQDLNLVATNKYKDISKKYKLQLQKCVELISIIKSLDPKPGRVCCAEKSVYIQPDVVVEKIDGEFIICANDNDSYRLRINNYYKDILKNSQSDKDVKEFIKERLNSATGLMKNIEGRRNTVLRIAEEIVKAQVEFLKNGEKYIKPLRMKDVAEKLECHESTISRGVNGKYMLTPFGLYEFRYFFSNAIDTDGEDATSSVSIKKIIQETIKNENKAKPLSDDYISKLLKDKGINVARRTVAKYREELGILSSSKRKKY